MRRVRYSQTFFQDLAELLEQGIDRFGATVVAQKRDAVIDTIGNFLARHPNAKRRNKRLGLHIYPISGTPFVVLYDFDDAELRVHFIFLGSADLRDLDPTSAEW